ncbi:MAG TPA: serine acetyltransferase, partial [Pirellulaceae bacterium]
MASDVRLKEALPELTDRIVRTYAELGSIHHLGHCPLPQHEKIVAALERLLEILYPGYQRREGLHISNITYHVGDLIDTLHDLLTEQFCRALRHEDRARTGGLPDEHDWE